MVRSRGLFGAALALWLGSVGLDARQAPAAPPSPRPPLAEEVFSNIQVLKGVPADQFLASMGFISNALAVSCTYCHPTGGGGGWAEYAKDDNEKKLTARRMMRMMAGINQTYFGGQTMVTCVSCHNGSNRPKAKPNIAAYYNVPTTDEPDEIARQATGAPTAEQVLDKYVQAVGGGQKLAALTSFVARGSHIGYGDAEKQPVEIFAKAPNQRSEIENTSSGPMTTTYDGRAGWATAPEAFSPLPQRRLGGGELEGARLDAALAFPAQIKQALSNWHGAVPTAIGDQDVEAIQGTMANGFPVKLYFADDSGLLVRQVRYVETALGRATWQIDYSDYRDVAGVKLPFKRTLLWQSGQSTIELDTIEPNVAIEASRFAGPPAAARSRR
jgi:hypothetical protein